MNYHDLKILTGILCAFFLIMATFFASWEKLSTYPNVIRIYSKWAKITFALGCLSFIIFIFICIKAGS